MENNKMDKKSANFNFLPWIVGSIAVVALILIINSISKDSKEAELSTEPTEIEAVNEPVVKKKEQSDNQNELEENQVAFLKLDSNQLDSLPVLLKQFYQSILETNNYASGVSCARVMARLNSALNSEMGMKSEDGGSLEVELNKEINEMTVNPRETANHFNKSGRLMLRKIYLYQAKEYPALAGQISELKSRLSDIDPTMGMSGQEQKVRLFFDQAFLVLYLMQEPIS